MKKAGLLKELRAILRGHPDGLPTPALAAMTSRTNNSVRNTLLRMPDAYIDRRAKATAQSGALSSRQITARIQTGMWWPFDRVPGAILVKMNAKLMRQEKQMIDQHVEEALW
jgi:hypothetical protein